MKIIMVVGLVVITIIMCNNNNNTHRHTYIHTYTRRHTHSHARTHTHTRTCARTHASILIDIYKLTDACSSFPSPYPSYSSHNDYDIVMSLCAQDI